MNFLLEVARCPHTGQSLREDGGRLVTVDGVWAYRVDGGIPVLLVEEAEEAKR